jgi:hypothetical protein
MDYINNDIYIMIDNDIPLIAYIYVGITSLVLAYVTYNDETNRSDGKYKSDTNTPILPAFLTGASENQTPNGSSANAGSGSILPAFMTGESKPASPSEPSAPATGSSILPSFMQTGQPQPVVKGGKRKQTKGINKKSKSNKSKKHK